MEHLEQVRNTSGLGEEEEKMMTQIEEDHVDPAPVGPPKDEDNIEMFDQIDSMEAAIAEIEAAEIETKEQSHSKQPQLGKEDYPVRTSVPKKDWKKVPGRRLMQAAEKPVLERTQSDKELLQQMERRGA